MTLLACALTLLTCADDRNRCKVLEATIKLTHTAAQLVKCKKREERPDGEKTYNDERELAAMSSAVLHCAATPPCCCCCYRGHSFDVVTPRRDTPASSSFPADIEALQVYEKHLAKDNWMRSVLNRWAKICVAAERSKVMFFHVTAPVNTGTNEKRLYQRIYQRSQIADRDS